MRRNINLILDVTPKKDITWGCIWRTRWQLLKPRQTFRITLCMYVCINTYISFALICSSSDKPFAINGSKSIGRSGKVRSASQGAKLAGSTKQTCDWQCSRTFLCIRHTLLRNMASREACQSDKLMQLELSHKHGHFNMSTHTTHA